MVKIVDAPGKESTTYTIRKVKRIEGGQLEYLLKSESNPISLLYHEMKSRDWKKLSKFTVPRIYTMLKQLLC